MIRRLVLDVDPEPPGYHVVEGGMAPYALGVSPLAIGDPNDEQDVADAEAFIEQSVRTLPSAVKLWAYRLEAQQGVGGEQYTAKRDVEIEQPYQDQYNELYKTHGDGPVHLIEWFRRRAQQTKYLRPMHRVENTRGDQATAGDVIRAARSWDAPVPQSLGFSRVVSAASPEAGDLVIFVPFFGDATPKPEYTDVHLVAGFDKDETDGVVRFNAKLFGDADEVEFETNTLTPFPDEHELPELEDGFMIPSDQPDALRRVLDRIEDVGATRLWSLAALLDVLETPPPDSGSGEIDPLEGWRKKSLPPERLRWLAAAGATAALEPVLLALVTPGIEAVEGQLIARYLNALIGKLVDESPGMSDTDRRPLSDITDEILRSVLIEMLLEHPIFDKPNGKHDEKTIIASLRELLDLEATVDDDLKRLDALLLNYVNGSNPDSVDLRDALRALEELMARLQEERGVERVIGLLLAPSLRLRPNRMKSAFVKTVIRRLCTDLEWKLDRHERKRFAEIAENAWQSFRRAMADEFDGSEAVRRTNGRMFSAAIVRDTSPNGRDLSRATLHAELEESKLFSKQFRMRTFGASKRLDGIATLGWRPDPSKVEPIGPDTPFGKLADALDERLGLIARSLTMVSEDEPEAGAGGVISTPSDDDDLRLMPPDAAPAPIAAQIAGALDAEAMRRFDELYNGLGVVIDREDLTSPSPGTLQWRGWAHANLANVHTYSPNIETDSPGVPEPDSADKPPSVRPIFPASVDDGRPAFVPYQGIPIASPAFEDTRARQTGAVGAGLVSHTPFVFVSDVDQGKSGLLAPPTLAYGRRYRAAAFAVTDAGILPNDVRGPAGHEESPWTPADPKGVPESAGFVTTCQRRTAIGRLDLKPSALSDEELETLRDVVPVDADYPRQVISAQGGAGVPLDIYRNADGRGALRVGDSGGDVDLTDLLWKGGAGTLGVEVLRLKLDPESQRVCAESLTGGRLLKIPMSESGDDAHSTLRFVTADGALTVTDPVGDGQWPVIPFDEPLGRSPYWLRLRVEPASETGAVSLSFADTTLAESRGEYYAKPEAPPRVLLRDTSEADGVWRTGVPTNATLELTWPRIGYQDFERWIANSSLQAESPPVRVSSDSRQALAFAYLLRGVDDGLTDEEESPSAHAIATLIESLPDPAVAGVRVTLSLQDALSGTTFEPCTELIPAANQLTRWTTEQDDDEDNVSQEDPPAIPSPDDDDLVGAVTAFREYLKRIDQQFRASVDVECGDKARLHYSEGKLSVAVPPGVTARLSFHILVPTRYCESTEDGPPSVFDPGIVAQHVEAGRRVVFPDVSGGPRETECHAFEGPDVVIETLADTLRGSLGTISEIGRHVLVCDPVGRDRAYTLRMDPRWLVGRDKLEERRLWRSVSHVEVETQEWRFSGRPIYNWPAREDLLGEDEPITVNGSARRAPVVQLSSPPSPSMRQFEREAFFDRSDRDASRLLRRLEPLPLLGDSTPGDGAERIGQEMRRVLWDKPSATLLRHHFMMRSRYAPAMTRLGAREAGTSPNRAKDDAADLGWTVRVLIRATTPSVELNRPQLRALVPLMSPPVSPRKEAATPPVLAILEEKPFAQGGLADRVIAMIRTGVHYGFPAPRKPTDPVRPVDVRGEFGPSPRLAVRAISERESRRLTVAHEGPIGLTFDSALVTAPTWSNSQHLFTPTTLDEAPLAQHDEIDLGVSIVRIFDPDWCDVAPVDPSSLQPAGRSWLIEFGERPRLSIQRAKKDGSIECQVIFSTAVHDGTPMLHVWRPALDPTAKEDPPQELPVCELPLRNASETRRVGLIHQALSEGRYRATFVLCPPPIKDAESVETRTRSFKTHAEETIERGWVQGYSVLASLEWAVDREIDDTNPIMMKLPADAHIQRAAASAPTELRWASVPRNAAEVLVAIESTETGATRTRPLPIERIRCLKRERSLCFEDRESRDDVWPRGRVGPSDVPIAVHRRLAIVLTRVVEGMGRPFEVFEGAALAHGKLVSLESNSLETGDHRIRLLEFETPSRPMFLDPTLEVVPEIYREVYFDTYATMRNLTSLAHLLTIRLVRLEPRKKPLKSIRIFMRQAAQRNGDPDSEIEIKIDLNEDDPNQLAFVDSIVLWFGKTPTGPMLTIQLVDMDGRVRSEVRNGIGFPSLQDQQGVFVKAAAEPVNDGDEIWADVSLLLSSAPPSGSSPFDESEIELDFDWLFTSGTNVESPAQAVQPSSLRELREVQARVVAVSVAIPVE